MGNNNNVCLNPQCFCYCRNEKISKAQINCTRLDDCISAFYYYSCHSQNYVVSKCTCSQVIDVYITCRCTIQPLHADYTFSQCWLLPITRANGPIKQLIHKGCGDDAVGLCKLGLQLCSTQSWLLQVFVWPLMSSPLKNTNPGGCKWDS